MSRELPAQPNFEYLKKEAKELLDAQRQQYPGWKLADAQHALARDYGFDSWPKLKAHVESQRLELSPLAGRWIADIARSRRNEANLFRRATLDVSVSGQTITIAHDAIDELGREDLGLNTIVADGIERVHDHGHRMTVRWADPRTLEVMTRHAELPAKGATYEVSPDGRTLIVSTVDQRLVFERSDAPPVPREPYLGLRIREMKGIIALGVVVLVAMASPAAGQTREFRQSVPFQPGGELVFDTDKGSVALTAWDRSEVAVYARIEADKGEDGDYARRTIEAARVDITGDARRLSIRSNFDNVPNKDAREGYRRLPHIHYQIQAPRSLILRLTADRSRVSLHSFTGRFHLETDRSPLDARDLSGDVQIRVDRGEIRLDALRGSLNLSTDRTNSRIVGFAIEGDSRLDISRGKVEMSVPGAQRLSVSARTGRRNAFSSEFPLATRSVNDRIEGPINGGGPRLSVEGDRSDVRLRRE